jgi:hypothetical protein
LVILIETSYETLNPCKTASSLEYKVQKRSRSVSTFFSISFVSVAVSRRSAERLTEVWARERPEREDRPGAIVKDAVGRWDPPTYAPSFLEMNLQC